MSGIICNYCTFSNEPNANICEICSKSLKPIIESTVDEEQYGIQCDKCTFLNSLEEYYCGMCQMPLYFASENVVVAGDTIDNEGATRDVDNVEENDETDDMSMDEFPQRQQECKLCYGSIGTNYFAMFDCVHIFCHNCAVGYFTYQITQLHIFDCICPMCDLPDLRLNADKHEQYFSLLLASLKPILDQNILNVFEKKLTEVALSEDPNFVWCIQCTSGFIKLPLSRNLVRCPDCRVKFCFECKKVWEDQHTNISCEQYAQWQRDNNSQVSQDAIGTYLQKNGIDCPKCKFKYDLSRGGCIHFTCTQCKHEFCFGCSRPFLRLCKISPYCKNVGLHAHHTRNCLHYLRDKTIADLQGLLEANKIDFRIELPERLTGNKIGDEINCLIELQIEEGHSIVDTTCPESTEGGQAGLCEKHYKELLISAITKANLETISILTVNNCRELLRFQGIAIPKQATNQKDSDYKSTCEMLVANNIPLQ